MASARQGLLIRYNFVIDNEDSNNFSDERYLVARLDEKAPAVGPPLVVYTGENVGDPLVVYVKTAVDNPLMVEIRTAVGQPLEVQVKDAVGNPLMVEIKAAVDNPEMVMVYSQTGVPLFRLLQTINPNPQYKILVPNVPYIELVPETRIITDSQTAALGMISQTTSWLPDHTYESADLALEQTEKAWAPFGGMDGAMIFSGHNDTRIQTTSTRLLAGLAWQRPNDSSKFLIGAFFEANFGKYHINADYGTLYGSEFKGKGDLETLAIGVMMRQEWDNGFRLEASGRYGYLWNDFSSPYFDTVYGDKLEYSYDAPFWAAHAGVGYKHKVNDHSNLDFVARYYITQLAGKDIKLDSTEEFTLKPSTSSRVRGGLRYTRDHNERMSYYVGAYWEQEFDGKAEGEAFGVDFNSDELRGGTGIGEIGISYRSTPDHPWSVEAGIQGYGGRNNGLSGGFRIAYEFK
jgi:hypothetical protein